MSRKKKPLWILAMTLTLTVLLMSSSVMEVRATEPGMVDPTVSAEEMTAEEMLRSIFSMEYYAEHNPDVVAVYGYDHDALYQHYIGCGIHEGRDVSPIVNLRAYRDCNPDILASYGEDWMGVLLHFTNSGISEVASGLRQPVGVRFDPVAYMSEYSEAGSLSVGDMLKAAELFIYDGMPEGEWITPDVVEDIAEADSIVVESIAMVTNTLTMMQQPSNDSIHADDSATSDDDVSVDEEVEQPSPPVPSCNHASVLCNEKCAVCGAVIGHDFGESSTEPYCRRCSVSYVQVNGCSHPEWNGGACVYCKKVDLYYQQHDSYHVDESCPDCGYQGTLLYDAKNCPGHEYGSDDTCSKCGGKKEESPAPPEKDDNQVTEGGDNGNDDDGNGVKDDGDLDPDPEEGDGSQTTGDPDVTGGNAGQNDDADGVE